MPATFPAGFELEQAQKCKRKGDGLAAFADNDGTSVQPSPEGRHDTEVALIVGPKPSHLVRDRKEKDEPQRAFRAGSSATGHVTTTPSPT